MSDANFASMMTLSPADVAHREDFATFAAKHSEPWHREYLALFYDHWRQWNKELFFGSMVCPYIMIAEIPGRTLGYYCTITSWGGKSVIKINRKILLGTFSPNAVMGNGDKEGLTRYALDTLLHEQIHQYNNEILHRPEASQRGHGVVFRDQCNRVAEALGWEGRVRVARRSADNKEHPSCAHWPSGVRPNEEEYYRGAWVVDLAGRLKEELLDLEEILNEADADGLNVTGDAKDDSREQALALEILENEGGLVLVDPDGNRTAEVLQPTNDPLETALAIASLENEGGLILAIDDVVEDRVGIDDDLFQIIEDVPEEKPVVSYGDWLLLLAERERLSNKAQRILGRVARQNGLIV